MLALMRREIVDEKKKMANECFSHRIEIDAVKMMSDRSETEKRKWRSTNHYHQDRRMQQKREVRDGTTLSSGRAEKNDESM